MDEKTEAQKREGFGVRSSDQMFLTPKSRSLHHHAVLSGQVTWAESISSFFTHKSGELTPVHRETWRKMYISILGGTKELGATWASHHRALQELGAAQRYSARTRSNTRLSAQYRWRETFKVSTMRSEKVRHTNTI